MGKKELLLNAAMKLFSERGFHATPTSAISKEAGVSAGILFHYFKTKDDLIIELYISLKKEYSGFILKDIDKVKSPRNKLRLIWSNSWRWGLENPVKFEFIQLADNSTYSENIKNHPEIIAKYAMFSEFIKGYIDQGDIKNINLDFLMSSMFGLIISMINQIKTHPELIKDTAFIEQAWEMFYNYLRP
jgi:AcrR family transcriptional regulator